MKRNPLFQLGRNTAYVLLGFPLAIVSFVIVITGLSLSAGLLITLLGIPVALVTLAAARGFGAVERARLTALSDRPVPARAPMIRRGRGLRGWVEPLGDGQAWLEALHAIIGFPVAVATFSIVVTWYSGALGGLTYPIWMRFLPENTVGDGNTTLAELLGFGPDADVPLYVGLGVVFLLTLIPVVWVCAAAQGGLARLLVANDQVAQLHERVDTLSASRAAVVEAGTVTLQKLERDLHDGPQQRLVRLQMDLASAERRMADDPEAARGLVVEAQDQVSEALGELRALSRGIAPPILVDRGLAAALSALAARCTVEVNLDVRLPDGSRLPSQVESTAYFVVAEALTNVAKHSHATSCAVTVASNGSSRKDAMVRIEVGDNGVGGASLAKGHGLAGLADRVEAVDGRLSVSSPNGGPTVLVAEIPVS